MITEASRIGAVTLESKELYYLANLLEASCLLGLESPIRRYLQDAAHEDWDQVRESLMSKGILHRAFAGDIEMAEEVFSSLSAVLFANKACVMRYKAGAQTFEECMHITDERVVTMERLHQDSSLHRVDEIPCVRQACGMLAGKMKWNCHTPSELPALMLSRRRFNEIIDRLDELDIAEIMSELSKVSDDYEGLIALAKCMKTSVAQGDLRLYVRNGEDWESQSARFINNHHMNWLIRASTSEDEDWLIATPTPNEKFQEMLQSWIQQPCEAISAEH